uniref:hypothetical protein n=1 Tax=Streptomyces sp. NBC_01177 TaxID=2903761 RepID=UPI002F90DAE0|nr:hypothetical protein OG284_36630 [Streptomyces sp. NBC_01177]
MTLRTLTARALYVVAEVIRLAAFAGIAFVILGSIAPDSSGVQPVTGPPFGIFVLTLALIGVAYLAVTLREAGERLGSTRR